MQDYKTILVLGNVSSPSGTIVAWPTLLFNTAEFVTCDILFNLGTFTGTNVSLSIQENFSGEGYLETANTGSLTATGFYWLTNMPLSSSGSIPTNVKMSSPLLGKGREKRIKVSYDGGGTILGTVYIIPYQT